MNKWNSANGGGDLAFQKNISVTHLLQKLLDVTVSLADIIPWLLSYVETKSAQLLGMNGIKMQKDCVIARFSVAVSPTEL